MWRSRTLWLRLPVQDFSGVLCTFISKAISCLYRNNNSYCGLICRQVVGIVLVLMGQALQFNVSPDLISESSCSVDSTNSSQLPCLLENNPELRNLTNLDPSSEIPKDFSHALLLYDSLAVAVLLLLVVGFRPNFKRLAMERRANVLAKLQHDSSSPSTSLPSTHSERITARTSGHPQNRFSSASTKL